MQAGQCLDPFAFFIHFDIGYPVPVVYSEVKAVGQNTQGFVPLLVLHSPSISLAVASAGALILFVCFFDAA